MDATHTHLAEELLRRFAAAVRAGQLYSKGHPIIARNLEALAGTVRLLHGVEPEVVIGLVGDEVIVDDLPAAIGENLSGLVRRLRQISVERVTIERGATTEHLAVLVDAITTLAPTSGDDPPAFPQIPRVRVGRVRVEERADGKSGDMATFRRLYGETVSLAEALWESALVEAQPDATVAGTIVDGLSQAVSENQTALLALATLKDYDNYTFTHMVNVSLLTMGQARSMGIDGPLLREFGMAALMHDIGKVRTPSEILNKPDSLTAEEFVIMRRHTVDGAEILRATPDIATLAPLVAFEHHLRLDGSGYPFGVVRPRLNLGTMLCAIADVYDAMRSQRQYQQAFPSDRILEVLKRNDGLQFEQHLVRRFAQLMGIYPPGNLVRLDNGELAVVVKAHAPDPHRPQVKVVRSQNGEDVAFPYELNLWECETAEGVGRSIAAPIDPTSVGLDPLTLL